MRGENGFGFTLRGDSPVLIAGVIPGGCAAVSIPISCYSHGNAGRELPGGISGVFRSSNCLGGDSSLLELSLGFAGGRHEMIKINF